MQSLFSSGLSMLALLSSAPACLATIFKRSIFKYKCTYFQKEILGVSFKDHTPVRLSSLKVLFHMLKYGNMSLLQPDKATGRRL